MRAECSVSSGDISLLTGFEFNSVAPLDTTLKVDFGTVIDRVTGAVTIALPGFDPAELIVSPVGAIHARIIAGGAEVDFAAKDFTGKAQRSDYFELGHNEQAQIELVLQLTENTVQPIFVALGIEFFQDVNGVKYSLNNGTFNGLSLIVVDKD